MPAPLSIIIPTLNAARTLPDTAEALLPGVTEGLTRELIVSDGGSEDGTPDIARELGATFIDGAPGRGHQIARGVYAAKGDWVLILHADTILSRDWTDAARRHMAAATGKAGYFRLKFAASGTAPRIVARAANLRSRHLGLPYGDQGLLISRRLLDQIGGVPEVPLMEDVILARRLKGRLVALDAEALTSADRFEAEGWSRRVAHNLWTLARFRMGAQPEDLAAGYAQKRRRR